MDCTEHEVISKERDLFHTKLSILIPLHGSKLHQTEFDFNLTLCELKVHTNEKRPKKKQIRGILLSPCLCPAGGPWNWPQSPFYFLRLCHFTKHSDISLEQACFVSENFQSKGSSYFCIETPLLVKITLWIIPISYLDVPHLLSMTIDSLWGAWLVFSLWLLLGYSS